jgi:hypothetical protein
MLPVSLAVARSTRPTQPQNTFNSCNMVTECVEWTQGTAIAQQYVLLLLPWTCQTSTAYGVQRKVMRDVSALYRRNMECQKPSACSHHRTNGKRASLAGWHLDQVASMSIVSTRNLEEWNMWRESFVN